MILYATWISIEEGSINHKRVIMLDSFTSTVGHKYRITTKQVYTRGDTRSSIVEIDKRHEISSTMILPSHVLINYKQRGYTMNPICKKNTAQNAQAS